MAHNPSRFVIIDGVQIDRERAFRAGLIDKDGELIKGRKEPADGDTPSAEKPQSTRARWPRSTRKG